MNFRNKDKKPAEDKSEEAEKRKWTKSQTNPQPGPSGSEQWDTTRDQLNSPQFKFPKWFKPNK